MQLNITKIINTFTVVARGGAQCCASAPPLPCSYNAAGKPLRLGTILRDGNKISVSVRLDLQQLEKNK